MITSMNSVHFNPDEWNERKTAQINEERQSAGCSWRYTDYARGEGIMLDSKGRPSIQLAKIPYQLKNFRIDEFYDRNCDAYRTVYALGKQKSGMVYLYGENTGKSRLCIGLYNGVSDRSLVAFADWQRMIDAVQDSDRARNIVMGSPMLIIDNFIQSPNDRTSAAEIRITQDIIEARNDPRKATLIASQISIDTIKKRSRTLASTLREAATIVNMN